MERERIRWMGRRRAARGRRRTIVVLWKISIPARASVSYPLILISAPFLTPPVGEWNEIAAAADLTSSGMQLRERQKAELVFCRLGMPLMGPKASQSWPHLSGQKSTVAISVGGIIRHAE